MRLSTLAKYFTYLRRTADSDEQFLEWMREWVLSLTDEESVRHFLLKKHW